MSRIRQCFHSRYHDGILVEADYSQLEIVVLAYLSDDEILADDLNSGRDLHCMRASELYRIPESEVTYEQRRIAKTLSFQLQYGAGAKTMSEINKIPVKVAKEFIHNFFDRYQEVHKWHQDLISHIDTYCEGSKEKTPMGFPRYKCEIHTPIGRKLVFKDYDSKYKKGETAFSPTEIKNYPVQSVATDIIKIALGALAYKLWFNGKIKIINTVHDNIVIDCSLKEREEVCNMLQWSMVTRTTHILKSRYDIELPVPLKIDIKSGAVWSEMRTIDI
jgi:DNA polymerase-1